MGVNNIFYNFYNFSRSLNMKVVLLLFLQVNSCCHEQSTTDTFQALQRSLKFHPYNYDIHCTYI